MIPQPRTRVCPACDGHPSVAITLGGRDHNGHLRTITAHCPACQGTGTTLPARALTTVSEVSGRG